MRHSVGANWPPLTLAWRFVARAALVWLFLRATLAGGARIAGVAAFDPSLANALLIASFAATAVWIDARRRHELHFLANLGVPRWWVVALAGLPALTVELVRVQALR